MRVLFVSKDATRTGAPMVLFHLLTWLKKNTPIEFEVILIKGGALENEFRKLGKLHVYKPTQKPSFFSRIVNKISKYVLKIDSEAQFFGRFKSEKYDLIYGNTVVSAHYVGLLKQLCNAPTILHVHELENVIRLYCGNTFSETKSYINHYIACAGIVKENLMLNHGINNSTLIYEFVPSNPVVNTEKNQLKTTLGISEDKLVIGGSGTLGWRKGVEYFLLVAKQLVDKNPNVYFVWLGGDKDSNELSQYQYDILNLGIQDTVKIISNQPNPQDYFNMFDVFLMTSKEDPFPLVCIENALLKKPIICFDKGVGSAEYIDNQVPYLDVNAMAGKLQKYINDAQLRESDGQLLYERAQSFTIDISAKKVYDLMLEVSKSA